MTRLDRWIQRLRIAEVRGFIPRGARLLDIGCDDGAIFRQLGDRLTGGLGIEPKLLDPVDVGPFRLVPGTFPTALDRNDRFDVITLLAVLEHIPSDEQASMVGAIEHHLAPGGFLIITVPSPRVDSILAVLTRLRLVHGMSVDEHYGFDPSQVPPLFATTRLALYKRRSFQFGLNNLFVFRLPESDA